MANTFDFDSLVAICLKTHEEMQHRAARSVDLSLVVRNWLFGWYMVEYEQNGADRAQYGSRFVATLSERLRQIGVKGSSQTRLKLYRAFYLQYKRIGPTLSDQLGSVQDSETQLEIRPTAPVEFNLTPVRGVQVPEDMLSSLTNAFTIGWSHYVMLLTIDNLDERRFYEIETAGNNWSVRELERQIASSLYERLALSRDKAEIRRLSREGQVVEKAADLIKNPLVLEFPSRVTARVTARVA